MNFRSYFEQNLDVKPGQAGPWIMARCPLKSRHKNDDRNPSLGCNIETGGLRCHGCVVKGSIWQWYRDLGLPQPSAFAGNGAGDDPPPLAYPYRNADGKTIYTVYRAPPKRFWVDPKLTGVDRVPFMLPEMLAQPDADINCTEGEKDALSVAQMGLIATATVGGSGRLNFSKEAPYFKGRHCIIWPDNDAPGSRYAVNLSKALAPYAASVKIVRLPGLKPGQDVTDWAKRFESPQEAGEELSRLAEQAPEIGFQPEPEAEILTVEEAAPIWEVTDFSEIPTADVEPPGWIIEGLLPKDGKGFFAGLPKVMKSFVLEDWLTCISRGDKWLDRFQTHKTKTLYFAREDPLWRHKVRLNEIIAGLSIETLPEKEIYFVIYQDFNLMSNVHLEALQRLADSLEIELLILDVVNRMIPDLEENSARDVGKMVRQLETINRQMGLTVLCVDHNRKPQSGQNVRKQEPSPLEMKGSQAKFGAADFMICAAREEDTGPIEIFAPNKDIAAPFHFLIDVSGENSGEQKFTYGGDLRKMGEGSKARGKTNREHVFEAVKDRAQRTREIAAEVEQGVSTVRDHLAALAEAGRIAKVGDGPSTKWRLPADGLFSESADRT